MIEKLGWTKAQGGTVAMLMLWAYAIGQFVHGRLADRFGTRLWVFLGGILSTAMNWGTSFMTTAMAFAFPWTANGFIQAMSWAPGMRMVSQW